MGDSKRKNADSLESAFSLANLVNYDTEDDAPIRARQRVHLHPDVYRVITALPLV